MRRECTAGILLAVLAVAGCGPIRVDPAITQASALLAEVVAKGLREDAPYEVAGAERHLELAREARGRSEYSAALRFAETSARHSREARDAALRNRSLREARKAGGGRR